MQTTLPDFLDGLMNFFERHLPTGDSDVRETLNTVKALCEECTRLEREGYRVHMVTSKKLRRYDARRPETFWDKARIVGIVRHTRLVIEGGRMAREGR